MKVLRVMCLSIIGVLLLGNVSLFASELVTPEPFWETCTNPPEGGEWCYGMNTWMVNEDFSEYINYNSIHSATVISQAGNRDKDDNVDPGKWAKASVKDDGPNFEVYYNVY